MCSAICISDNDGGKRTADRYEGREKERAQPGIEPGTSRILLVKPEARIILLDHWAVDSRTSKYDMKLSIPPLISSEVS